MVVKGIVAGQPLEHECPPDMLQQASRPYLALPWYPPLTEGRGWRDSWKKPPCLTRSRKTVRLLDFGTIHVVDEVWPHGALTHGDWTARRWLGCRPRGGLGRRRSMLMVGRAGQDEFGAGVAND